MFTGIVEEVGTVRDAGRSLTVECAKVAADAEIGTSIAVNGVCLTAVAISVDGVGCTLGFDVSDDTLARSSLGELGPGARVNLERPVTLLTRLGGHVVQGHVDGVGTVERVEDLPGGRVMAVTVPEALRRYLVEKGSVAVDGVSLTVARLAWDGFEVALVPHTLAATTLGGLRAGARVNLEVDVMAKYVEALLPAVAGMRGREAR